MFNKVVVTTVLWLLVAWFILSLVADMYLAII